MSELERKVASVLESAAADMVADVTARIVEIIPELVRELVRERLEGVLAAMGSTPATKPERKPRKPRAVKQRDTKPAKSSSPACRKCGQAGHNARTCGRTAEVAPDDDEDEDEDDEPAPTTASPPPSPARRVGDDFRPASRDRFATIEASARRRAAALDP